MISPRLDWKEEEMLGACRCGGSCGRRKANIPTGQKIERNLTSSSTTWMKS